MVLLISFVQILINCNADGDEDIVDYDVTSEINRVDYKVDNNQNNDDVKPYSSDVDLNVDNFNHLAFDVANNSKSVQNNDDNILLIDCEVDNILCLLEGGE